MSGSHNSEMPKLDRSRSEPKTLYFLPHNRRQIQEKVVNSAEPSMGDNVADGPPIHQPKGTGFFNNLFRKSTHAYQPIPEVPKQRKVPIKVEPKVFFANERTFLSWLHMSVTLASISLAIVAFSETNPYSKIYGLVMLPVAIAFCAYSLFMYIKRASMIRRKDPGPYEAKFGPIVLGVLMGLAIVASFATRLFHYAVHNE